ncbi:glycosyltransferase family 1 protein [Bacillus sp. V5-8f]|uniref:glycosyltransferase family 1 protein n=1 Tax=Bacillus sp. V5-8f TaxID=2053044 RepID=UPI000C75D531|nr:glycosyltransferase family 1 protein [Bacillus sp. V5-8f]PLT35748.1 glycosyltransferase family 1 protein [Bacillus sp. V5-8f]
MKQPVRILHIFNHMNPGGAETMIMNLYRKLDRSRIQFDFAVSVQERGHFDNEIEALGGRIFRLSHPSQSLFAFMKELKETLLHGEFHAVHSHVHYFSGITISIAKRMGIPIRISHSHNTEDGQVNSLLRYAYRSVMKKRILKHSTHLLACSHDACFSLFSRSPIEDNRIHIIKNAIDLESFRKNNQMVYSKKDISLPESAIVIGHIGRFSKQKNHEGLIHIFSHFHNQVKNAHLVLVGEGELRKNIENLVKEKQLESYVHFLGVREDISSLLTLFDVFLFPSLYEGLGVVLIEAQAAGVQCVISANIPKEVAIVKEMVSFVPLEAPLSEWQTAIENALTQNPDTFNNRKKYLMDQGYDINASVKQLELIYA